MKQIHIFPKEWLQLHPYKQSDPTDSYYTQIANRIYDIMVQTQLANSFKPDEVKQISLRIAAYFEDVISQLNIWRSFITQHKALYGKYLPFYTPDDHYYEDEANYEDIRFLLWHYTQQYHGVRRGTFVSPDNVANAETALLIYQLFCDEWTTAPENERMQQLFAPETRYDSEDKEALNKLLEWFFYQSYLFTDYHRLYTNTAKEYMEQHELSGEDLMNIYSILPRVTKTPFFAYTASKWLSFIVPQDHPDYALFAEEGEKTQTFKIPESDEEKATKQSEYERFTAAAEGHPLVYFTNKQDAEAFFAGIGFDKKETDEWNIPQKSAFYATPEDGVRFISHELECIKDERNPFYNQAQAEKDALSFFMVEHCAPSLLRTLEENGMLADAQGKSLVSEARSKAIIHENWDFLMRYFLNEY